MTPAQIKKALEIHRKYQLAELTRYARNPLEKKSGQLSFQHLLRAWPSSWKLKTSNLRGWKRRLGSTEAIPTQLKETHAESLLASPEEGGSFFSVTLAELGLRQSTLVLNLKPVRIYLLTHATIIHYL